MREVCVSAVAAAVGAGASYADARVVRRRSQSTAVRNGRVDEIVDVESEGVGVRVLVGGAWGFAADRSADPAGARDAALRAAAFARAAAGRGTRELAPTEPQTGSWRTAVEVDPLAVPLDDRIAHLLRVDEALRGPQVVVRQSFVRARR